MGPSNLTVATLLFVALVSSSCALTDIEIDNHYRRINPPAVHKFLNPKEGTILCVKWSVFHQSYADEEAREGHPLIFKGNPANSCPEGTVQVAEISRTNMESHLKAIEAKKRGSMLHFNITSSSNRFRLNSTATPIKAHPLPDDNDDFAEIHEYAIVQQEGEFFGASARFEIWKPDVRDPAPGNGDFSLAQIWVAAGSHEDQETIEVGWEVNPRMYRNDEGDPLQPRFFLQYSRENYKAVCTNLECTIGERDRCFTPTRPDHVVGRVLNEVSHDFIREYKEITIFKGPLTNEPQEDAWYLFVGGQMQGYIKASFFTKYLNIGYADSVDMGGEVSFDEPRRGPKPPHTPTDMGNGHHGSKGPAFAAMIAEMRVLDAPMTTNYPFPALGTNVNSDELEDSISRSGCYNSYFTGEIHERRDLFYGGPGYQSGMCE
eukprot:Gb_07012 [translate_table: standard]